MTLLMVRSWLPHLSKTLVFTCIYHKYRPVNNILRQNKNVIWFNNRGPKTWFQQQSQHHQNVSSVANSFHGWYMRSFWSYSLKACDKIKTPTSTGCKIAPFENVTNKYGNGKITNCSHYIAAICMLLTPPKSEVRSWKEKPDRMCVFFFLLWNRGQEKLTIRSRRLWSSVHGLGWIEAISQVTLN